MAAKTAANRSRTALAMTVYVIPSFLLVTLQAVYGHVHHQLENKQHLHRNANVRIYLRLLIARRSNDYRYLGYSA